MGGGDTVQTIVDDDSDSLNLGDNEIEDDLADFDIEHGISMNDDNSGLDYYPGMRGGRHAFLGEPEDFKTKVLRLARKTYAELTSYKTRKLVIGLLGLIIVLLFFAIMLFSGEGADKDLPGGGIHNGQDPEGDLKSPPFEDKPDSNGNGSDDDNNQGEPLELVKMNLDDMRQGSYWVFDRSINFFDFKEESLKKRESDGDDEEEDDDDSDDDDDHDDDDDDDSDDDDDHEDEDSKDNKKGDDDKNDDGKDNKKGDNKQDDDQKDNQKGDDDEGYFLTQEGNVVLLRKAANPEFSKEIIDLSKLSYDDAPLEAEIVSLTKSLDKVIVSSEKKQHWRHSSFAKYWLVDTKSLSVEPVHSIIKKTGDKELLTPVPLAYAAFSPDGKNVYFHYNGNLFLKNVKSGKVSAITNDGNTKEIFNGKPDWVYEEEVLASDRAIYWESEGNRLAFIRWDDTDVPVYNLEIFGDNNYPEISALKYPKPGYPNAKLSLFVYDIEKSKLIKVKQPEEQDADVESLGDDFVIYQTAWLNANDLIFKRTDRTSRKIQVCHFSLKAGKTVVVRNINTDDYSGWYKNNGDIFVLPDNEGYIDMAVIDDHDHLVHYKSASDKDGEIITSGDWDVIGGVKGYDKSENAVYFIGTHGNALQRHVYKVVLGESELIGLTDLNNIESYSLKTSSGGKWGLLKYAGPELPYQKLVDLTVFTEKNYIDSLPNLNNAQQVDSVLQNYQVPFKEYISMKMSDGVDINVVEVKPANFDESKQYPVLVSVYGGPGIQKVSCDFGYGFEEIVSSSMEAIVLYIDPRGTGGSSWKYRSWARDNIGYWEPRDIVEATQNFINDRDYIDTEKVAIWGWSYGGFTTLKTLEYDQGVTFKYGLAVAPVTNWYLYDSIYTERYMGFPSDSNQYKDAKISEYNNFKNVYRFLVMHGTGDDNVHYQNTLQLLNHFDINGVENYDVHVFTDSDHNIAHDNANTIVYDKLFNWLAEAFDV